MKKFKNWILLLITQFKLYMSKQKMDSIDATIKHLKATLDNLSKDDEYKESLDLINGASLSVNNVENHVKLIKQKQLFVDTQKTVEKMKDK